MRNLMRLFRSLLSNNLIHPLNGKLPKQLLALLRELESHCFQAGLKNSPSTKENDLERWRAAIDNHWKSSDSEIILQKATLSAQLVAIQEQRKKPRAEWLSYFIAQLQSDKDQAIEAVKMKFGQMSERLGTLNQRRIEALSRLDLEFNEPDLPLKPNFIDKGIFYVGVSLIFTGVETAISWDTMDKIGVPIDWLSGVACFFMSVVIAICCHLYGDALAKKNRKAALSSVIAGTIFTAVIILLRFQTEAIEVISNVQLTDYVSNSSDAFLSLSPDTLSPQPEKPLHPGVLGFANMAMLGVGLLVAERVNRYQPLFEARKMVDVLNVEIEKLMADIASKNQGIIDVVAKYDALATKRAEEKIQELEAQELSLQEELAGLSKSLERDKETQNNWIKEGAAIIEAAFERGSNINNYSYN